MRSLYLISIMMFSMNVHAEERIFPNMDSVVIDSAMSNVILSASKDETAVKISYTKKDPALYDQYCRLELSTDAQKVTFSSQASKNGDGRPCAVEVRVSLPLQKTVDISIGKGNVHAKGSFHKIVADIGAGKLVFGDKNSIEKAKGFSTKIAVLNVGTGDAQMDFDVMPEQADISLEIGWGSISLSSKKLAKSGNIHLEQGSGDTEIYLPKGSLFSAEFSSVWGRMTSELPIAQKSDFSIEASAGMGKMRIFEKK